MKLPLAHPSRELSRKGATLFVLQTTHSEYISLKFVPTEYAEVDNIVLMESRKYDATTSQMKASWAFYTKRGEDLEFIDRIEYEIHVYSLSELSSLLREAGWDIVASYGDLSTLQLMSPITSLNIVAKAR